MNMNLEQRVERLLSSWRMVIFITSILSGASCIMQGEYVAFVLTIPMLIGLYFAGLFVIAQFLKYTMPVGELIVELQSKKVKEINERLAAGTLEANSPELEELMKILRR